MARIYVSGLVNVETTVQVRQFPIPYYPIDYPFFGVNSAVSGVAYNIARALKALGDEVVLASWLGNDVLGDVVRGQLIKDGFDLSLVRRELSQTPSSVVLYEPGGRRQIYCDLKDIQERRYPVDRDALARCDLVAACNINFNRPLLWEAKAQGKTIATDVHVLSNVEDDYNREFMEAADILFLSDEGLPCSPSEFLSWLAGRYQGVKIIVMGRGSQGAMLYTRENQRIQELPCVRAERIGNTVGAGDALFSAFLHFYGKGHDPLTALWQAQTFASAKIAANGGAEGFLTEAQTLERWKNR